jgi:hypothetical protein
MGVMMIVGRLSEDRESVEGIELAEIDGGDTENPEQYA